jgi:predicted RNA-binding protein associated with RNAse of E/G family
MKDIKRPVILRRRLIPSETVSLSGDELLYRDGAVLITRWRTIHPKKDFAGGVSVYFLGRHYKISRFYGHDGSFLYWYCDVLDVSYDAASDTYLALDLLLDVKVHPDGRVELLDEDELEAALSMSLVTPEQHRLAMDTAAELLSDIASGAFPPEICRDSAYW